MHENKMADQFAKKGTRILQKLDSSLSYHSAKLLINVTVQKDIKKIIISGK
jgi:hypothetical protein